MVVSRDMDRKKAAIAAVAAEKIEAGLHSLLALKASRLPASQKPLGAWVAPSMLVDESLRAATLKTVQAESARLADDLQKLRALGAPR
jgi:hypothetical protein